MAAASDDQERPRARVRRTILTHQGWSATCPWARRSGVRFTKTAGIRLSTCRIALRSTRIRSWHVGSLCGQLGAAPAMSDRSAGMSDRSAGMSDRSAVRSIPAQALPVSGPSHSSRPHPASLCADARGHAPPRRGRARAPCAHRGRHSGLRRGSRPWPRAATRRRDSGAPSRRCPRDRRRAPPSRCRALRRASGRAPKRASEIGPGQRVAVLLEELGELIQIAHQIGNASPEDDPVDTLLHVLVRREEVAERRDGVALEGLRFLALRAESEESGSVRASVQADSAAASRSRRARSRPRPPSRACSSCRSPCRGACSGRPPAPAPPAMYRRRGGRSAPHRRDRDRAAPPLGGRERRILLAAARRLGRGLLALRVRCPRRPRFVTSSSFLWPSA